jgi:manganese efflux pump family protein
MGALLLVALSVGMDNFGAATALGLGGVDGNLRVRVAVIFGLFEGAVPVVGVLLGHVVSRRLGGAAPALAGALLGAMGLYTVVREALREPPPLRPASAGTARLMVLGAALSLDNLVIGFALGAKPVSLVVAALVIALVSTALSLLGLELGQRVGPRLGSRGELVGGVVLVGVGVAVGTGLL